MSINLTDEIDVKTKKGKLGAAKQIFLEGDMKTVENEIQDINSRHNSLNTKHESLSRTVQGIAATSGASTATNVTYNNDSSGLNAENAQDAIDELSSIGHFAKRGGIVNISTNYNSNHIAEILTLSQALSKVPSTDRVLGFQGKYLATDGWHTIIYTGNSLTSWSDRTKWIDLADKVFNSISNNATFAGIATPATNPGTPDGPIFYITTEPGAYSNFNGISVADGEAAILEWNNGAWTKKTTGFATILKLNNEIHTNNKISPFVLINKYSMTENGWYNIEGEFVDSNEDFQRVDYPITPGAKFAYCKNIKSDSGFAICFMNGDTLLRSVQSANEIVKVDMSEYPTCTNIRISTKKDGSEGCFVLIDYINNSYYSTKEVNSIVFGLNKKITQSNEKITQLESLILEYSTFENSKTWDSNSNHFYLNINENVNNGSSYIVRADADISKMLEGAVWNLAVEDIDGRYYYARTNMSFNQDIELITDKKIVRLELQVNKSSFKESVNISFSVKILNEKGLLTITKNLDNKISSLETEISETKDIVIGQPNKSVESSTTLDMTSTAYIHFESNLPKISNKYEIEVIEGSERINPKTVGCIINNINYIKGNSDSERVMVWESDTKASLTVLESDLPINTFIVGIGIVNQLQTGIVRIRVTNISENKGLQQVSEQVSEKVNKNTSDIESLDNRLKEIEDVKINSPSIHICKSIDCIVGDTIQIYYNMFIQHIGDYSLNIKCSKGKNYPRYWEYTPTSNDVGTTDMVIQLLNINGNIIEEKTVNIITKNAVNPSSPKNILLVGDSLYMGGQIPIELSRRLKGTVGTATSPSALSLSNFNIVGRLKNSDGTVGWEGTGGWSWDTYTKADGMTGVRLTVSGITDVRLNQDCRYKMDNYTQNFYITEINVNDGTGYIFAAFYGQGDIYKDQGLMPQSGTLKRITGEGQEEINFTASQVESYQPFWNSETNSFDIISYVNTYCDGHLEILCVQLGINSIIGANPFTVDFNVTVLKEAKKFINLIHSQLPDTKIYLATLPLPSQNGGIGANYVAANASGSYLTAAWNYKVHKVNDLYRSLMEDSQYNTFVSVIDVCSEIDSENNYPSTNKPVNTRAISKTEVVGNNGIHPNTNGYYQISDTWFRAII